jgi:hypothetical protein
MSNTPVVPFATINKRVFFHAVKLPPEEALRSVGRSSCHHRRCIGAPIRGWRTEAAKSLWDT